MLTMNISVYNEALEERIEDETGGDFETFLVGIINRPKFNESGNLDVKYYLLHIFSRQDGGVRNVATSVIFISLILQ